MKDNIRVLVGIDGSNNSDLWGINIYPELNGEDFVEFDSMINIKPALGNRSRGVDNPTTKNKILEIVEKLLKQ